MVTEPIRHRPVVSFVVVTLLISWSLWFAASRLLTDPNALFIATIPGGFGPALAAAVVVSATGGSVREWVRDMARWRLPLRWYLAALGLPILFSGVESIAYATFIGPLEPTAVVQRLGVWAAGFVIALFLTGGIEEPGWRGFMQSRLQRSYSALTAALMVGVVWTVWHLPMHVFFPEPIGGFGTTALLSRAATVPLAVVYAWLYNATDGSVVIAMLFHAGWNSSQSLLLAPLPGESGTGSMAAVIWGARGGAVLVVVATLLVVYGRDSLAPTDRHTRRSPLQGVR